MRTRNHQREVHRIARLAALGHAVIDATTSIGLARKRRARRRATARQSPVSRNKKTKKEE